MSAGSSDDVETVKRAFDAFARRDMEGALDFIHPDVRLWLVTAAVTRGGRPYVGHEGLREYARDVEQLWREIELRPVEFDRIGTQWSCWARSSPAGPVER